jgi:hypothetical protein
MVSGAWLLLLLLHSPLLCLHYFWDEGGYYALAAYDFYQHLLLIPRSTWALGHTPLGAIYLGSAWHIGGLSPCVARVAMVLIAAATVISTYELGRRVFPGRQGCEAAAWGAALLALSPLFFAQSTMLHIDLPAALFVTLAAMALLRGRLLAFAFAASFAFMSKETAAIILPVAWVYRLRERRRVRTRDWAGLLSPLLLVLAWALWYHHKTGFWTGNHDYLQYNLYSTLNPIRFLLSLVRRIYQLLVGGFDFVLVAGAILGLRPTQTFGARGRQKSLTPESGAAGTSNSSGSPLARPQREAGSAKRTSEQSRRPGAGQETLSGAREAGLQDFMFLAAALCACYVLFHSVVGGALLRRYLLPIYPVFYLGAVWLVWRLPKPLARGVCGAAALLFVAAWFFSGPYSFEFESNLAYADFVRLHEQAAHYLESRSDASRILTAWPATGELTQPFLGYVAKPLLVVPIDGFGEADFSNTPANSFDLLYLYSRKAEAVHRGLMLVPWVQRLNRRYFGYAPQVSDETLAARYHLKLLKQLDRHGQWVRIYAK